MLSLPKHLYRTVAQAWAMRPRCFGRLSMIFFWLFGFRLALAQQQPAPRVYTYVEQMPQLPGGGGQQAIANEILKRFKLLPGRVEPSCYRIVAYFEVSPTGLIQHARIVRASQSAVVDSSLLAAIRSLPTLYPGYQQGRPVTVGLTIPCNIATQ